MFGGDVCVNYETIKTIYVWIATFYTKNFTCNNPSNYHVHMSDIHNKSIKQMLKLDFHDYCHSGNSLSL